MAIALIVAAGSGERLGAGVPKALVEVAGRTLLERSIDVLLGVEEIAEIVNRPMQVVAHGHRTGSIPASGSVGP